MGDVQKVEQPVPGLHDPGRAQREQPGDEPLFRMKE
jgi:hypothetical protein